MRGLFSLLIFVFGSDYIIKGFAGKEYKAMIDANAVRSIVQEHLDQQEDKGFFLVQVVVKGANEIMVEIDHDDAPIDIDTIANLSRWVEEHLDRDKEDFELTVSSAGLTSPLLLPRQYRKYINKEMIILLKSGIKENGILTSANEEGFSMEITKMVKPEGERRKRAVTETRSFLYADVKSAVYDLKV